MKRFPVRFLPAGATLALVLALAIPALGQDAPESLLPPGFEDTPPPQQGAQPPDSRSAPAQGVPGAQGQGGEEGGVGDISAQELAKLLENLPAVDETQDSAHRPVGAIGPLQPAYGGLAQNAFGNADGRYLSTLMRRLDAPLPSRWASILLRRALLSAQSAPRHVNPVDWAAERSWLLLRMGEADGARLLVQAIDVDRFTPKMFMVAVQTALANADVAGLCPLVTSGRKTSKEAVWALSDAMCAALKGQASHAGALIDQVQYRGDAKGIDFHLAEKVIGSGTNTRRAVTIQWNGVEKITAWRFGLAAATGLVIPERLMRTAGPRVQAWQARAPMIPVEQRTEAAETAAALGVFSNASLVEIYSLIADTADVTEFEQSVGGKLRTAYAGPDANSRIKAMRALWGQDSANSGNGYARQILTGVAASRVIPAAALAPDAAALLASMLAAGIDRGLNQWAGLLDTMDAKTQSRAWALLALGSPQQNVRINTYFINSYKSNDDSEDQYKSKLLIAALAGLGRLGEAERDALAENNGIAFAREDTWTRALDTAVRMRQPGTVALLAAVAMQTPHWRGVPPEYLYRILRALKQTGLDYEARMIAAEALGRA